MTKWLGVILLFSTTAAHATTWQSFWRNRDGVHKFNEKSYHPAYQSFLKALEDDPFNVEVQMNLARTFEANEEWEKAEKSYSSVLKILPADSAHRFEVLFNLGGVFAKENKIDRALEAYQAALDMMPDSKEVKTNIELLWQGGGGGGQNQDKNDKGDQKKDQNKDQNKDGQGQQQKNQQPQPDDQKDQKQKPKPFQSQELNQQDVKKILDEIKNQEQSVRAQEYERNVKDAPRGKDW